MNGKRHQHSMPTQKKPHNPPLAELPPLLQQALAQAHEILRAKPGGSRKRKTRPVKASPKHKPKQPGPARKIRVEPITVELSGFNKVPKGTYGFNNAWHFRHPIKTRVGKFGLSLFMSHDPDPPDDEMVRLAGELVRYAQAGSEHIRDIIYGHYRYYVSDYGPDALPSAMPADLKPPQIWKYCRPYLFVARNPKTN